MKTFKEAVKFQLKMYLISNKIFVPFVVLFLCLYVVYYNGKLEELVASYNITSVICFYLMFIVGLNYNETIDLTTEQLLVLRLKSERKYYLCNEAVLFLVSCMFAFTAVGYSLLANFLKMFTKVEGRYMIFDLVIGLFLHIIISFAGAMIGSIFHDRIFRDRYTLLCVAFVTAVISIAKELVLKVFAGFRYIMWVFPPVSEYISRFKGKHIYYLKDVGIVVIGLIIYTFVIGAIKEKILIRKKF